MSITERAPEVLTEGQQQIIAHRAATLQHRADALTQFRRDSAPVIGAFLALDNGEHRVLTATTAVLTAASEVSDVLDGRFARQSASLLDRPTTVKGGEDDHRADKLKYFFQIVGLATRSLVHENDPKQATFVVANGLIQKLRDHKMKGYRAEAISLGIDGKARKIGKAKGLANGIGGFVDTITPLLPEKAKKPAQKVGNIALATGTVFSLLGLLDMKMHVHKSKKEIARKS